MLHFEEPIAKAFPGLKVLDCTIKNVRVTESDQSLQRLKDEVSTEIRSKFSLETLKDQQPMRAYRDFFWRVGTDPTKNRPASEALIRRILLGKPLPTINTLVDAYNIASIRSGVPIAAFDLDRLRGSMRMRFAKPNERFLGIGMEVPTELKGSEIVIEDDEGLTAIYPYRDAERTKIALDTKGTVLLFCGVPGVEEDRLEYSKRECVQQIIRFCGGVPA
jgi:DNA/RNA-binding domain of Phe-tRNA-synthetase-like protein